MIHLPMKAEVHCSDGLAGRSTYAIGNPMNRRITHLVVQSLRPPFYEILVPVDQVEETAGDRIKLKCTRDEQIKTEPFEVEEYRRTEMPGYLYWTHVQPPVLDMSDEVEIYVPVKRQNVPTGELALQRGARVEATDGYVGQVDELLINSKDMQVASWYSLKGTSFKRGKSPFPSLRLTRFLKTQFT